MKLTSDAPIWLCGGADVASTLMGAGLVDAMVVKLNPVVFGSGIPLFEGTAGHAPPSGHPQKHETLSVSDWNGPDSRSLARKMRRSILDSVMIIGCTVTFHACSLISFQSPEVLDSGDYHIGAGLSYVSAIGYEYGIPMIDVFARRGLVSNLDGGIRLSGIGYLAADLKYQVLEDPLHIAADLGISGGRSSPLEGHTLILAGRDRLYIGGRLGTVLGGDRDTIKEEGDFGDVENYVSYGVLAGASLGTRSPIVLEVGLHHWFGDGMFTIGIAHRRILGGN